MKKVLTAAVATTLVAGSVMAGANLGLDFANAHIFRGATVADELVIQPTVELSGFGMPEEYGEFTLGAWGSMAPFANSNTGQDTPYETDWYLTYMLPELAENLDLYVGLTEYTYSGPLNERELNLGAGYALGDFYLGASFNYMLYNQTDTVNPTKGQIYIPLSADWTTEISEGFNGSAGALISFLMQGDGNGSGPGALDDGFNHYEIYGALDYALGEMWSVDGSLAYIGQGNDKVLVDAGNNGIGGHNVSVLLMVGLSCEL